MSDQSSKSGDTNTHISDLVGIPHQLQGNPKRQATPSITGTVYQAWCSIEAWLRLNNPDEVIFLEGAEDFDIVNGNNGITIQVKHHAASISLSNKKALDALNNFWEITQKNPTKKLQYYYLTTSSLANEQGANFGDICGIDAWRIAQTNLILVEKISDFLKGKLDRTSNLYQFLNEATPSVVQEKIIKMFHWQTNQPDIETVKQSVNDRIANILVSNHRPISLTSQVSKFLESRFWQLIVEKDSAKRYLSHSELHRQIEEATTVNFPVPIEKISDFILQSSPGLDLFYIMLQRSPVPPEPLIQRTELTQQLEDHVKYRQLVLLTGTVFKGKSTLAQLVASKISPNAWWLNLSGRRADQIDLLLLALANSIDKSDCPDLIIIDDLDISPNVHRAYKDSLSMLLHRSKILGRGIIITAQGESSEAASLEDFANIIVLEVPELTIDELKSLCLEQGCPQSLISIWSNLVLLSTRGHPKLAQVQLAELKSRGWPNPKAEDLLIQSSAVLSAKQMSRRLLSVSVSSEIAEFIYTLSELTIPIDHSTAKILAASFQGLSNAGDIIDNLIGKWIEKVEGQWLRITPLLQGMAKEVWTDQRREIAHLQLHNAIAAKTILSPHEAAALLFHAYIGKNPRQLALTAIRLQILRDKNAENAVLNNLQWLSYVSLEPGTTVTDDPHADTCIRSLQFKVATLLNDDSLIRICGRWSESIDRITDHPIKVELQKMMWFSFGISQNPNVLLIYRLTAIIGISNLNDQDNEFLKESEAILFSSPEFRGEIPQGGTTVQMFLLCTSQCIKSIKSLTELLNWLDLTATDSIRREFETMLGWPLCQTSGAFVQGAWAANHSEETNWPRWLPVLDKIMEYSKRRNSPRFGSEAAKAKSIILAEYLINHTEALKILDEAESIFGPSTILKEQRANILFHNDDDKKVIEIWHQIKGNVTDPFAFRRAAISAAKQENWKLSEDIFKTAIKSLKEGELLVTKNGLRVDAAFVALNGGSPLNAITYLADFVDELLTVDKTGNEVSWDLIQRFAIEVCTYIESTLWKHNFEPRIKFGAASSPGLNVIKIESGEEARYELTLIQIYKLLATTAINHTGINNAIEPLMHSKYFLVRFLAVETKLSLAYASGAGAGFIEAMLDYINALSALAKYRANGQDLLKPDNLQIVITNPEPENWLCMLYAGLCCSKGKLLSNLEIWLESCRTILGMNATLSNLVYKIMQGTDQPIQNLENIIRNSSYSTPFRCGAASRLLLEQLPPESILIYQCFLASGAVANGNYLYQSLFNRHIAKSYANKWNDYLIRLSVQSTQTDNLLRAIDSVENGAGTLNTLLSAGELVYRKNIKDFMVNVL